MLLRRPVLIIGAGRTGMLTARHLSTVPNCSITIVEAKSEVGGLWAYEEMNELHPREKEVKASDNYYKLYNCFQGSIYPHVTTNITKSFLSYKDFSINDFDPTLPDILTLKQYHSYLNAYWDHFGLKKYVVFNTLVKSLRLYENLSEEEKSAIKELPQRTFVVTTIDSKVGDISVKENISTYDYVIVSVGMNVKPYIPTIKGISNFKGSVIHVKEFREPDDPIYQDKTILVLGGSASAIDMVVQLYHNPVKGRQKIKKIIFCANDTGMIDKTTDFKDLKEEGAVVGKKGWVDNFTEDSATFSDGTTEKVDVVIFCTGYCATFPFLDLADKILDFGGEETRFKFFGPLYKRMVSIRQPKLFFPGYIDYNPLINYISEVQVMLLKHLIDGSVKLPSVEEMMKEYEEDVENSKANSKYGTLSSFFNLVAAKYDVTYIEGLRKFFQHLYPGTEEIHKKHLERKVEMLKKNMEFINNGNMLSLKRFDFSGNFPEEIKNTTEFI